MSLIPMDPTQIDHHASYHSPLHPLRLNAAIKICIEGDSVCTRYASVHFSLRQVLKEGSTPGLARFHNEHIREVILF